MKTKATLIFCFLIVVIALAAVYQGQIDGLGATPVAEAGGDLQKPWSFPTPSAGRAAEIAIEVPDLSAAVAEARRIAAASGGQVAQSDRGDGAARLLLTIPVSQFDTAFQQLRNLSGTVTHDALGTAMSLDSLATLQAQADVLAATDGKLRQFLAEAKTPEAVLKLESQLLVVQQELTTIRTQLAQQQLLASTVTVSVTLEAQAAPVPANSTRAANPDLLQVGTFALLAVAGALAVGVAAMFGRLAALRPA